MNVTLRFDFFLNFTIDIDMNRSSQTSDTCDRGNAEYSVNHVAIAKRVKNLNLVV